MTHHNGYNFLYKRDGMRYLKDLLFTDTHLIKGHIHTGGQRLSTFLNNTRKRFLEMEEATLIKHSGGDSAQAGKMLISIDDILLAHEMEETGDEGMRHLGDRAKDEMAITAHFRGDIPLELSGTVRKRAIDSEVLRDHDFVVVLQPALRGLTAKPAPEYSILENPAYVIANRKRIAYIFPQTQD
jgi:hypothetical protein